MFYIVNFIKTFYCSPNLLFKSPQTIFIQFSSTSASLFNNLLNQFSPSLTSCLELLIGVKYTENIIRSQFQPKKSLLNCKHKPSSLSQITSLIPSANWFFYINFEPPRVPLTPLFTLSSFAYSFKTLNI